MRKTTSRTLLTALAILIAGTSLAAAQGRPEMAPPGPPPDPVLGMAAHALHELDLSADQRSRIREIIDGYLSGEFGTLLEQEGEARRALDAAVWSETSGEQDLADAAGALAEVTASLAIERHALALDILEVLTQEQRETLQRFLEEGPKQPGRPDGHRGPAGPGPGGPGAGGGPGGFGGPGRPGR